MTIKQQELEQATAAMRSAAFVLQRHERTVGEARQVAVDAQSAVNSAQSKLDDARGDYNTAHKAYLDAVSALAVME